MNSVRIFADRTEAGRVLARTLAEKHYDEPVVLALPRGGVPVALEVAKVLDAPLDLLLVRKIGVPYQPELALGAVIDGGHPEVVINEDVWRLSGISNDEFEHIKARELAEIKRRRELYLKGSRRAPLKNKTVIVIDDGIATGATVRVALKALRRRQPKRLVLAVPVAPADTLERLQGELDDIVCLETPEPFYAIGLYYRNFDQLSDQQVSALLAEAKGLAQKNTVTSR